MFSDGVSCVWEEGILGSFDDDDDAAAVFTTADVFPVTACANVLLGTGVGVTVCFLGQS